LVFKGLVHGGAIASPGSDGTAPDGSDTQADSIEAGARGDGGLALAHCWKHSLEEGKYRSAGNWQKPT
jgi:hypothetical protein